MVICCKLLDHIIYSSISIHLTNHKIICKEQHGFRKLHSCETQLLEAVNDLAYTLNRGDQTDLVLLDFSKAFDKVSHKHLLYKLHYYGIQDDVYNWINDFLTNRTQRVVLDNVCSDASKVLSGVPQGSVLGPLLFLIFINDIPSKISSIIRLYADDVIIYHCIKSNEDVLRLQEDIDTLSEWADTCMVNDI